MGTNVNHFGRCSQRVDRSLDALSSVFSGELTGIDQGIVIHKTSNESFDA
jgi:hypothetical protein